MVFFNLKSSFVSLPPCKLSLLQVIIPNRDESYECSCSFEISTVSDRINWEMKSGLVCITVDIGDALSPSTTAIDKLI